MTEYPDVKIDGSVGNTYIDHSNSLFLMADGSAFLVKLTYIGKLQNNATSPAEPPMRLPEYRKALAAAKPAKRHGRPKKPCAACLPTPGKVIPVDNRGLCVKCKRFVSSASEEAHEPENKLEQCQFCGREIPTSAIAIHRENCAVNKAGYATHVSQPGSGRGSNDQ